MRECKSDNFGFSFSMRYATPTIDYQQLVINKS